MEINIEIIDEKKNSKRLIVDNEKVLVINTLYKEFGGEDSNINDEVEALKKILKLNI